jgi:hypothetical protein
MGLTSLFHWEKYMVHPIAIPLGGEFFCTLDFCYFLKGNIKEDICFVFEC